METNNDPGMLSEQIAAPGSNCRQLRDGRLPALLGQFSLRSVPRRRTSELSEPDPVRVCTSHRSIMELVFSRCPAICVRLRQSFDTHAWPTTRTWCSDGSPPGNPAAEESAT